MMYALNRKKKRNKIEKSNKRGELRIKIQCRPFGYTIYTLTSKFREDNR